MTDITNILNLYAGVGGNRKRWQNVKVTAIEFDEKIAAVYKKLYPDDEVIVTDAHEFLRKNINDFDFIWSSPPCPTHSDVRRASTNDKNKNVELVYPDMALYQEILLLKHFAESFWVVENVKPYYKPLIAPNVELHRHYFWSNYHIPSINFKDDRKHDDIVGTSTVYGINIAEYDVSDKRKCLRNMVNPAVAEYVLNCAREYTPPTQQELFMANVS